MSIPVFKSGGQPSSYTSSLGMGIVPEDADALSRAKHGLFSTLIEVGGMES